MPRGVELAILLTAALAVVLLLFAAGYWYFVKRDHQSDELTGEYADDERGRRG
jgi:membrane protein implicated in regulation of membrane protease activity